MAVIRGRDPNVWHPPRRGRRVMPPWHLSRGWRRGLIFRLHRRSIPDITGTQPAIWRLPNITGRPTLACFEKPASVVVSPSQPSLRLNRLEAKARTPEMRSTVLNCMSCFLRHNSCTNMPSNLPLRCGRQRVIYAGEVSLCRPSLRETLPHFREGQQ